MKEKAAVLLVEDNADHAEQLRDALERDFRVDVVADRSSCLQRLTESQYAFLIIDYYLDAGESGLEILRELNASGYDIPRIVVTAYGNEEVAVEALKLGAHDYVPKTLNEDYMTKVVDAVKKYICRRYTINDALARTTVLQELQRQRETLYKNWRQRARTLATRYGLSDMALSTEDITHIYDSVISDLESGSDLTTQALLDLPSADSPDEAMDSFVSTTLFLIAFKDAARTVIREAFPHNFDSRAELMEKLGQLVEGMELRLAKWFGSLISQQRKLEAQTVELQLKSKLVTTLQHQVRQPLSFILNCSEYLLSSMTESDIRSSIDDIRSQAEQIALVLNRIEETTEIITREYAEGVEMLDLQEDRSIND